MIDLGAKTKRETTRWLRSLVINRLRAGNPEPRILANSIPKAGTHLLIRYLQLLPGVADSGIRMRGSTQPVTLEKNLKRAGGGCFVPVHLAFSPERARLLADLGYNSALIIRDPRDVVVSHFHYVTYKSRHHRLHPYYQDLADDSTRLLASIQGIEAPAGSPGMSLDDIGTRYRAYLEWADHNCYITRFEDLVGPQGGGSLETQRQEILALAEHLGISLTGEDIERITNQIFDRTTSTFRKGEIGDWKNHLAPQHKAAFKQVAGQILVDLGYEGDMDW